MCDQQSLRSACAYAQSDQSLCKSLEYSMIVKLLTEHYLEFLSLKGGCRGLFESTRVKMPLCWKSHALAHILFTNDRYTRQVLNETLRNAAVGSWAARYTDHDIELGGYKILQKVRLNTDAIF